MDKKCYECGNKVKGRSDKKFCCEFCRNSFHNKLNSDSTNYVRNINNILRRNRRILEGLVTNETAKTPRQKLLNKGFNFDYFTHVQTTQKGNNYFFCYEFGFLPIEENFYFLVKRKAVEF